MTETYSYVPTPLDTIAAKTDHLFADEERLLGNLGADIFSRLLRAKAAETREPVRAILVLQLNALSTTMAAIELWRRGFLNQEAILLRNAIEALATAAVLNGDEESYRKYKKDQLDSAKSLTKVKKLWPIVGSMLANANEFVQYRTWNPVNVVTSDTHVEWVRQMLMPIKFVLLVLDFLSECTCYGFVSSPRYWNALGNGQYEFLATAEGRALMNQLVGERAPDAG